MEFDGDFMLIQGSLISLQKMLGDLKCLNTESGCKQEVETAVETVKKTIQNLGLDISRSADKKFHQRRRRICFFLVLNSDLSIKQNLVEDSYCGHLVECVPTLSINLLTKLIWGLSMQKYLFEVVMCTPTALAVEILEGCISQLENLDVQIIPKTASDLIFLIFNILEDGYLETIENTMAIKARYLSLFKAALNFMEDPLKVCRGRCLTDNEAIKYEGCVLKHLIYLVNTCISSDIKTAFNKDDRSLDVYCMDFKYSYSAWPVLESGISKYNKNTLFEYLLQALMKRVNHITVDKWLEWVEYDSEDCPSGTLQRDIGEAMFVCSETLRSKFTESKSLTTENLVTMMSCMSVKPKGEEDEIKEATIDEIIKSMSDPNKSQNKWLKAFLIQDDVFTSEIYIKHLESNLHLVQIEDAKKILEIVLMLLNESTMMNTDMQNSIKLLAIQSIHSLSLSLKLEFVQYFFAKYGWNTVLLSPDFSASFKKFLNSVVNNSKGIEELVEELIPFVLQSPKDVLNQLMVAALTNNKLTSPIVNIIKQMQMVWDFSQFDKDKSPGTKSREINDGSENLIIEVLKEIMGTDDWNDIMSNNLITLVKLLLENSLVDANEYYVQCLFFNMSTSLKQKEWSKIKTWLQIWRLFVDKTFHQDKDLSLEIDLYMLLLVIEQATWNEKDFSMDTVLARQEACSLLDLIINDLRQSRTCLDSKLQWLLDKIAAAKSPFSKCYFTSLFDSFDLSLELDQNAEVLLLEHVVSSKHEDNISLDHMPILKIFPKKKAFIVKGLILLLPHSVPEEWLALARCLKATDISPNKDIENHMEMCNVFFYSLICLSQALGRFVTDDNQFAKSWLDYCFRNMALVIMEELLKSRVVSSTEAVLLFEKLICMIHSVPDSVRYACTLALFPILKDLLSSVMHSNELKSSASYLDLQRKLKIQLQSLPSDESQTSLGTDLLKYFESEIQLIV